MIRINGHVRGQVESIAAIQQIPSLLQQGALRAMTESLQLVSATSQREFLSGPYPTHLQPRTRRLRASMKRGDRDNIFRVDAQDTRIIGEVGTNVEYARIHEVGGIIRPKRGQFLAIPTEAIKTPTGLIQSRYRVESFRQVPNTFIRRSRSGSPGIYERFSGGIRRIAHLLRQVTMPPRPFLGTALQRSQTSITERFQLMVQTIIDRANQTLRNVRR